MGSAWVIRAIGFHMPLYFLENQHPPQGQEVTGAIKRLLLRYPLSIGFP